MGIKTEQTANSVEMALPDFRNLGVSLRVAMLAETIRILVGFAMAGEDGPTLLIGIFQQGVLFEPALLTTMLFLALGGPQLSAFPYRTGCIWVAGISAASALGWIFLTSVYFQGSGLLIDGVRAVVVALAVTFVVLAYFNWRHRALSPALSEARLLALQARIRPHFLFNSLNTVLGLIREEPKRAETVLEGLAELFRALMAETNTLTTLAKELDLARSYLDVEMIRLGDRLSVDWQCQSAPLDALLPPMVLQPLLENAVYYGIEPAEQGGKISVTIFAKGGQLNLVVRNPVYPSHQRKSGNKMALNNIRERLELHFDVEAAMRAYRAGDEFVVQIRMPLRHGNAS